MSTTEPQYCRKCEAQLVWDGTQWLTAGTNTKADGTRRCPYWDEYSGKYGWHIPEHRITPPARNSGTPAQPPIR